MAARLSRRKLAHYAVDAILEGTSKKKVLTELAAYLIDTRRTRERDLLVRDIEEALAARGVTVANITSARPLTKELSRAIEKMVGGNVQARSIIDETVLGGVRIELPGKRFDGTIRRKLIALKAKQL